MTQTEQATVPSRGMLIDGELVASSDGAVLASENPATEEVIGRIPACAAADVDRAVAAARAAFDGWAATSPEERAKYLTRLQDAIASRHGEIAAAITAELGSPAKLSELVQVGLPMIDIATAASMATEVKWEEQVNNSTIVMEPVVMTARNASI